MSIPNNVDYSLELPTNPDTLNYNYDTANYNEPRPIDSNYTQTNYDITNYPKTDYTKFNSDTSNYDQHDSLALNAISLDNIICGSPDMLYQETRDPQYNEPTKYMCFNTQNKLVEITRQNDTWVSNDLTNSDKHITWESNQCKIITNNCTKDDLTEKCKAKCYTSPNNAFILQYKNNIWRRPDLEKNAGSCTMTAISEDTAQNSFCQCNNVLERPILETKPNMDVNRTGKFWCSS